MSYDREYYKDWYTKNRNKVREIRQKYYQTNKLRIIAKQIAYNRLHRDKCQTTRSAQDLAKQQSNAMPLESAPKSPRLKRSNWRRRVPRKSTTEDA